ncbi:hypothetical protein I317_01896 [Kwoniella heveanensis CBS 569]|uniref:Ion transport domain-containing protein n=1 Tax=Kwoniella heveanensis BCC8398 TaxID=1296120 RepID=A0A1B9GQ13_9TREE|nr:hypothetical protein I316_05141 [Kwoniella heveanensis BCC8398]OCF44278.1 hypothetical protein I317_01896 [Kwoniella heveanensis CBS 569]
MPRDPESNLTASDFELEPEHEHELSDGEDDSHPHSQSIHQELLSSQPPANAIPARSQYHLPPSEQLRGVANRIIFSRYYILFYGAMMGLSFATLVISLIATHGNKCPPAVWHILEVVINILMVVEVGTRWVAYGKKYPLTLLNVVDIILVLFCSVTLILVFRNPCGSGTRSEELLDTILLIIRNTVQFLRLGSILRRSGHSILNPPKPIDLSQAGAASLALDLDMDLENEGGNGYRDEEVAAERQLGRTGAGAGIGIGLGLNTGAGAGSGRYTRVPDEERDLRTGTNVKNNQGRENLTTEDEEMWDRL